MNAQTRYDLRATIYVALIYGLPALATWWSIAGTDSLVMRMAAITIGPISFATLFAATAGALSLLHQKGIVEGKFLRRLSNPIYFDRRLYGLCWTTVYYCKPLYFILLSIPWLKRMTFRLFGYRGNMDFTIYADTWIRDLPLLAFGEGSYIGNRACIGSNQCFGSEHILVQGITVEDRGVVGHLSMVGPGAYIEAGAELGAGCAVGMRTRIGRKARVGAVSAVGHGASVGEYAEIGAKAWVGHGARIEARAAVAPGQGISRGAVVGRSVSRAAEAKIA